MRKVQVDFKGLMKVVGANLYSTPMVAIRELVQNAHDSCVRRGLEAPDATFDPQITVRLRGEVLGIEDNGAVAGHNRGGQPDGASPRQARSRPAL